MLKQQHHGAYTRCMSLQTEQRRTHDIGFISYSSEQSHLFSPSYSCNFIEFLNFAFFFKLNFSNPHSLSMKYGHARFHFSFFHIFIISNQLKICIIYFFMLQKLRNQKDENLLHTFNDITLKYVLFK